MKSNIAVIFGGQTCEHDISVITSVQAMNYIDENFYHIIPIYITRENEWLTGSELRDINTYANFEKVRKNLKKVILLPNSKHLYKQKLFGYSKSVLIDVALVVMHGKNGEDGTISGLLNLSKIPYTCSDVVGSGVCLDKLIFKKLMKGIGLNTIDYMEITKRDYLKNVEQTRIDIEEKMGYPFIVKPCNLGSSIGISVCKSKQDVEDALALAFELDTRVLIEKYISNLKEINVAILGSVNDYTVSEIEEPIRADTILSFENKYLNQSNSGMASAKRIIPANIEPQVYNQAVANTVKIFKELNLKGVVRIDYILDKDSNILYVNEANSIPGSLAFYLFKPKNIDYKQVINKLIKSAVLDMREKEKGNIQYFSSVLQNNGNNFKQGIKK